MCFLFFLFSLHEVLCTINPNIPFPENSRASSLSINHSPEPNTSVNDEKIVGYFPDNKVMKKNKKFYTDYFEDSIYEHIDIPLDSIEKKSYRLWRFKNNYRSDNILSETEMKDAFLESLEEFNLYNIGIFQEKNRQLRMQNKSLYARKPLKNRFTFKKNFRPISYEKIFNCSSLNYITELSSPNIVFKNLSKNTNTVNYNVKKDFFNPLNPETVVNSIGSEPNSKKLTKINTNPDLDIENNAVSWNEITNLVFNNNFYIVKTMQIYEKNQINTLNHKVFIFYTSRRSGLIRLDSEDQDVLICKDTKFINFFGLNDYKRFHCLLIKNKNLDKKSSFLKLNNHHQYKPEEFINLIKKNFLHVFEKKSKNIDLGEEKMVEINFIVTYMSNDKNDRKLYSTETACEFRANLISVKDKIVSVLSKMFYLKFPKSRFTKDRFGIYFKENSSSNHFRYSTKNSHYIYDRFCLLEIFGKIVDKK